jgi:hypothetical protein
MIKTAHTLAALAVLAAAACSSPGVPTVSPSPVVSNSVAAAEIALTNVERLALRYTTLPRCPAAALCSDAATVQRIKDADNKAYAAVMAARHNEALLGLALSSIEAFGSVVPR